MPGLPGGLTWTPGTITEGGRAEVTGQGRGPGSAPSWGPGRHEDLALQAPQFYCLNAVRMFMEEPL